MLYIYLVRKQEEKMRMELRNEVLEKKYITFLLTFLKASDQV